MFCFLVELGVPHLHHSSLFPHVVIQEHLAEERRELESQKETYQQDLERLRESTRAVEREKERLENQKKIKRKTIEVGGKQVRQ